MDPLPKLTRRRMLSITAVAGSASLAGCWEQTGATDVAAVNLAAKSKRVSFTITDASSETEHTARTLDLAAGEEVPEVNKSKLPTNTSYTIDVVVKNGPRETFEWKNPSLEAAPLWVLVDDSQNVRFLTQVG